MKALLELRHILEKEITWYRGNIHGAGTDLTTGITDFSFDYEGRNYKVVIEDLGERNDRAI